MEKLFSEFNQSNAADWKKQLIKELKGEDYESLRWQNENGFVIEPFYTSEDLTQVYSPAFYHPDWQIAVKGNSTDSKILNQQFLTDLNRGATSIIMRCDNHNLDVALEGVQLNYIHATFIVNHGNVSGLFTWLAKHFKLDDLSISLFPEKLLSLDELQQYSKAVESIKHHSNIKWQSVDVLPFHNQNCFAYYEVAIIASAMIEYLECESGTKSATSDFVVKTGVSADYFIQMAKLRAIRRIWEVLIKEYNVTNGIHVIVETGLTNKSISDSYNNLLRTTVEAMSAVGGGCNELVVNGFDTLFKTNTSLSERMAINQQLVLKHESYFDKMADVACGSYYIESLTDAIASKAIEQFKKFELQGGYFSCLEKAVFEDDILKQSIVRQEAFNTNKQLAIGVNKFKNEKEKISLSSEQLNDLKKLSIKNPALNFELHNFFN